MLRELYITEIMNDLLAQEGLECGNISSGFWHYDENF